jgi:hypothetical protein
LAPWVEFLSVDDPQVYQLLCIASGIVAAGTVLLSVRAQIDLQNLTWPVPKRTPDE